MPWSILATLTMGIIDKVIPDKKQADAAKLELLKQGSSAEIKKVKVQMSAIIAEGKSKDPFTSRARPCFLYVIYIYILAAIPMGVVNAYNPDVAANITAGVTAWLNGIPDPLWALFGTGYLGYLGVRSFDKAKLLKGDKNAFD